MHNAESRILSCKHDEQILLPSYVIVVPPCAHFSAPCKTGLNPLTPRRTLVAPFTKISILF